MSLELRCDLFILSRLIEASKRAKAFATPRKVEVFLDQNRKDCDKLIERAQEATQPRHEFEGHIHFARFAAPERSVATTSTETISATTQWQQLGTDALAHLDAAEVLHAKHPGSTADLQSQIEETRAMLHAGTFYAPVTAEETKALLAAMATDFRGTGHWYTCENGHPFTIGECGMPMQQSRCPQCGAAVGGRDHTLAQGVGRANDLDAMIRDMHI